MGDLTERVSQLSPVKRALLQVEQLQSRLSAAERAIREPVAVVGMSCRFPGNAGSPSEYWRLLHDGVDAITEVPRERWNISDYYDADPEAPGKMYCPYGGFLTGVDRFDPWFFRISPREAASMDPQQRLLLEVSWEALEDAGVPPDSLRGSKTGVFAGITTNDYAHLLMRSNGCSGIDGYFFTGNPLNTTAGRLSYTLGLQGPSMAIDTACSSSLVAIHQACQSLRLGECELALAGGVNLILSPDNSVAVCRTRALAPDGRCKTFDAAADGFVRSEGCGMVALKTLSKAAASGDRILAVIRGSAVNHDGASSGFTVPNGKAQEEIIRMALGNIAPSEIDYVEAHGTGTSLGDPIEVIALAAVLGAGRAPGNRLRIGSAKTNIGHAESAAGVAGLIKVILALRNEEIPAHLHCDNPSPLIPWKDIPVEVCRTKSSWPSGGKRRLAGVSAFGASGTNAHVILEEAPQAGSGPATCGRPLHALVLSAKNEEALHDLAGRYRTLAEGSEIGDICFSAATGRSHFRYRLGIAPASREDAALALDDFRAGRKSGRVHTGEAGGEAPRVAFLFTGQGAQYAGMGQELYRTEPVFRRALDRCSEILRPDLKVPLVEAMHGGGDRLDQTEYCQPAMFALGYALADLLKSWGIQPGAVLGHSVGEYTAACVAGIFSLEDGLRLVARRARLMQALPQDGGMAAVFADEANVREYVRRYPRDLAVAAVNGPRNTVISGTREAVGSVLDLLRAAGVQAKALPVSHAFHSRLIEPMLDEFEAAAGTVKFGNPAVPVVSNLTGSWFDRAPDAGYWRRHAREPVMFGESIRTLLEGRFDVFVELGPRPVLTEMARACRGEGSTALFLPALAPRGEWAALLDILLRMYVRGVEIDWSGFHSECRHRRVSLPTYPFQRRSFWFSGGPSIVEKVQVETPRPATSPHVSTARLDSILKELQTRIAEVLRAEVSDIDVHVPFLEMGADSLVLTEATRLIERQYGVQVSVRRFFEDLSDINSLAVYIDQNAAPDTGAVSVPEPVAAAPSGMPVDGSTSLERILIEQNRLVAQLLSQQTELLRQQHAPVPAAPTARAAVAGGAEKTQEKRLARKPDAPPLPWGSPVQRRAQGLSPTQHKHLEDLIARYTARTRTSKAMVQDSRGVLADSRAAVGFRFSTKEMLYPIVGAGSVGSKIRDVDGNEYIDFTMGFGVHLFGHGPDFINRAVEEEFRRGVELGARSSLAGEVARRIARLTGQDRVAFSNSGTEAVMAAMRLARAATGRQRIALFTNSYHGHADGTLAAAEVVNGKTVTQPMVPGVPPGMVESILVLDYGTEAALSALRECAGDLAAVMVEPVQSRNPSLQPAAFLREVRRITEDAGAALIFDEMITGFRVHPGGAQGLFGIQADLATYGKIVGGGLPIGVIAGKSRFMDGIDGGGWSFGDESYPAAERTAFGGTFCQHPLALAASLAVLRKLEDEGPALQAGLNERTARLARELNEFFSAGHVPVRIAWFGSMFRFEFSANLDLLFYHLLEKGIFIWEWRTCFLSTAHTEEDLAFFVRSVKESVAELRDGGFLPGAAASAAAGGEEAANRRIPLSEAQKQLWLATRIEEGGSLAYNVNVTIRLRGRLNHAAMTGAVEKLVARHEALRTTIAPEGECQIVWPSLAIQVPLFDYSALGPEDQQPLLERLRKNEGTRPFDLVKGPLFRASVIRLEKDLWLLVLTAHHIIADGTTMGVLMDEIAGRYSLAARDSPGSRAIPAPMQFREYLELAERKRASGEVEAHRQYWLRECAGALPVLNLPADRPRPPVKTYHGARVTWRVETQVADGVRKAARGNGCTLYMALLAGFNLFLHRITGQDDIIVGIPVTGRPFPGSERVVGYCTHLLPLRSRYNDSATAGEVLKRSSAIVLNALDHQEFPFAELVRQLGAPRSTSVSPIVSAVFNLEPISALPEFAGLAAEREPSMIGSTAFDLSLNVIDTGRELAIDCDYNTNLFDEPTIRRLLGVYQAILQGLGADAAAAVSRLPMLSEAERQVVLRDWNDIAAATPTDVCVHQLIEAQAARTPERTAIVYGSERICYRDLNERAERLAEELAKAGVGPEVLVGVACRRTPDMLVGILAILKAGGAFVPLDPAYPKARLEFMMQDAAIPVLLTHRGLTELPQTGARTIFLDSDWATAGFAPAPRAAGPGNLAYVIYTSGSTGRPKGVAITHRSAVEFVYWARSVYTDEQLAGVLMATSICFDLSIFELFVPFAWGGAVIMAENALEFPKLPAYREVTLINTVPSLIAEILKAGNLPPSVNTVNLAGERLHRQLVQRIYRQSSVRGVYNLYGPTEDTVFSTWALIDRDDPTAPTIGRPVPNTQAYILDRNLQVLPPGVPGELFVAGAGLARGYLNRPELTRERFISNPFGNPGDRMYRTGDLARYRADGKIEYMGRADTQVKLRGFRIELGEVEAIMASHPWVENAVAMLRDEAGSKRIVAYLATDRAESEAVDAVKRFLRERLPEYMLPSAYVVMKEFCLLPNGKVDRERLPESGSRVAYLAPRDEIESALAAIWQEVLGKPRIGVMDDFFEIGGDSLSAMQVVVRVEAKLRAKLEIRSIFTSPTIADLARQIARGVTSYEAIAPTAPQPDYELSPVQKRFWVQACLSDRKGGGTVPTVFHISGPLDSGIFERVFRVLLERHEILRTVFVTKENQPRQKVLPLDSLGFAVQKIDLTGAADQEAEVKSIETAESFAAFDLARGPLVRVKLLRLADDRHVCTCCIPHIVIDGWSTQVLMDEFVQVYDAIEQGKESPLVPLALQYRDYAAWLNGLLRGPRAGRMRDYWMQKLSGELMPLDFPTDFERAKARGYLRKVHRFRIPEESTRRLEAAGTRYGVTLFMTLLASIKTLLYRNTGQEDIIIGTPVAGRVQPALERQIGPYLNTVAMRDTVIGDDRFDTLLERIRETTLEAYANQIYPFDLLLEDLSVRREAGRNPLFDVGFTLHNQRRGGTTWRSANLEISEAPGADFELRNAEALTDFWFAGEPGPDAIEMTLVYNGNLYREATARRLCEDLAAVVESVGRDPGTRIHGFRLGQARTRTVTEKITIELGF